MARQSSYGVPPETAALMQAGMARRAGRIPFAPSFHGSAAAEAMWRGTQRRRQQARLRQQAEEQLRTPPAAEGAHPARLSLFRRFIRWLGVKAS